MKTKTIDVMAEAKKRRRKEAELHKELYRAYNRYEHSLSTGQGIKKNLNDIVELKAQIRRLSLGV